jgi:hypothetical protein
MLQAIIPTTANKSRLKGVGEFKMPSAHTTGMKLVTGFHILFNKNLSGINCHNTTETEIIWDNSIWPVYTHNHASW